MKRLVFSFIFAGLCFTSVEAQQKKTPQVVRTCTEVALRRNEIHIPQVKGVFNFMAELLD